MPTCRTLNRLAQQTHPEQDYGDDGSQKCSGANCVYDILMANFQVDFSGLTGVAQHPMHPCHALPPSSVCTSF